MKVLTHPDIMGPIDEPRVGTEAYDALVRDRLSNAACPPAIATTGSQTASETITPDLVAAPVSSEPQTHGYGWEEFAACRTSVDPSVFYGPDRESAPAKNAREAAAKVICAQCVVRVDCNSVATVNDERYGV